MISSVYIDYDLRRSLYCMRPLYILANNLWANTKITLDVYTKHKLLYDLYGHFPMLLLEYLPVSSFTDIKLSDDTIVLSDETVDNYCDTFQESIHRHLGIDGYKDSILIVTDTDNAFSRMSHAIIEDGVFNRRFEYYIYSIKFTGDKTRDVNFIDHSKRIFEFIYSRYELNPMILSFNNDYEFEIFSEYKGGFFCVVKAMDIWQYIYHILNSEFVYTKTGLLVDIAVSLGKPVVHFKEEGCDNIDFYSANYIKRYVPSELVTGGCNEISGITEAKIYSNSFHRPRN